MPDYWFFGTDCDGQSVEGQLWACSKKAAREGLCRQGIASATLVEARPEDEAILPSTKFAQAWENRPQFSEIFSTANIIYASSSVLVLFAVVAGYLIANPHLVPVVSSSDTQPTKSPVTIAVHSPTPTLTPVPIAPHSLPRVLAIATPPPTPQPAATPDKQLTVGSACYTIRDVAMPTPNGDWNISPGSQLTIVAVNGPKIEVTFSDSASFEVDADAVSHDPPKTFSVPDDNEDISADASNDLTQTQAPPANHAAEQQQMEQEMAAEAETRHAAERRLAASQGQGWGTMLDQRPSANAYPGLHEAQIQESRVEGDAEAQKTYQRISQTETLEAQIGILQSQLNTQTRGETVLQMSDDQQARLLQIEINSLQQQLNQIQ